MNDDAAFRLPAIISDGMILQRNKTITIWGWDHPHQSVQVSFQGKTEKTKASSEGKWSAALGPFPAGGPYEMTVEGSEATTLSDIYLGEVWLAGGQSNMELPLERTFDLYQEEIENTDQPLIREFHIPMEYDFHEPQEAEKEPSFWKTATQGNVAKFSAVGYFFAQKLHKELNIPVGIILAAIGGTPAEAWLSKDDLKGFPPALKEWKQLQDDDQIETIRKKDEERISAWYEQVDKLESNEQNENGEWTKESYHDSDWREMHVPVMFHQTGLTREAGSLWFRKKFFVDNPGLLEGANRLRIGAIIDYDEAYLNGELIGKTEYRYPPRRYPIPPGLLREGENILAVRVIINGETGGFIPGKFYGIEGEKGEIDLSGPWKYKRITAMEPLVPMTFFQYKPTGLYNGMLSPIRNYVIKGFLFYQGESNTHEPENYTLLMKKLIECWRNTWRDGTLPFLYVQLANYQDDLSLSQDNRWAELRQQQARVECEVKGTAMTVSIDVGEGNDLHPQNKKTIGRRLAADALQIAYQHLPEVNKPILTAAERKDSQIILSFSGTAGGLEKQTDSAYFEVEYGGGKWKRIPFEVGTEQICLHVNEEKSVTGIRYAWLNNPENPPFYNKTGYPLAPFIIPFPIRKTGGNYITENANIIS